MKATDFIRMSLEMSQNWIFSLLNDMKDAPTTFPTPKGGNHPLWILGHLTYSEAQLTSQYIKGEPNPLAEWEGLFGMGSQPMADAGRYPPFDKILAKFEATRANTLKILASMSDSDLDKPSKAPEEIREFFGTIGACFAAVAIHLAYHGGQVADARRAAGRKPLMG